MWKQIRVDGVELGTTGLKFLWNSESDANHFFFQYFLKPNTELSQVKTNEINFDTRLKTALMVFNDHSKTTSVQ